MRASRLNASAWEPQGTRRVCPSRVLRRPQRWINTHWPHRSWQTSTW